LQFQAASWVALFVTAALVPIRLLGPRPSLRRMGRQPGFQASVAALLIMALHAAGLGWNLLNPWPAPPPETNYLGSLEPLDIVGQAVAMVWLVLALNGGWRPERSWIDSSGRILGLAWILGYIANEWSL
jgi:hypothetical protein